MKTMDPKAAADHIRDKIDPYHFTKQPPETHHALAYITQVVEHLGLPVNGANLAHVAQHLTAEGIKQHMIYDYPKWVRIRPLGDGHIDDLLIALGSHRVHATRDRKISFLAQSKREQEAFFAEHGERWEEIED